MSRVQVLLGGGGQRRHHLERVGQRGGVGELQLFDVGVRDLDLLGSRGEGGFELGQHHALEIAQGTLCAAGGPPRATPASSGEASAPALRDFS